MTWFVSDWREGWRWLSVHVMALCAIMPEVYENADFLQYVVSESQFRHLMAALGLLALLSRFVQQPRNTRSRKDDAREENS